MVHLAETTQSSFENLDQAISDLKANKDKWAKTSVEDRINILNEIKDATITVAADWVKTAGEKKQISPEAEASLGEEWLSGPNSVLSCANHLIATLSNMKDKAFLKKKKIRETESGQIAVTAIPSNAFDKLLLAGITAEVWMQPGVNRQNLEKHTATAYDIPEADRVGKVALVLGAGNIASIPPLDCFQKLFTENQVVILKMNPVNDYLTEFLEVSLNPLISRGFVRIVRGGVEIGEYLCNHPDIEEIHITGAAASHDAIVWGPGEEGRVNKQNGTPKNSRRMTSELGGVGPTIVVPGPWSDSDINYHAEHIASQKLHNSGFNCVAVQMLILPENWDKTDDLVKELETIMNKAPKRGLYYPGAENRMSNFEQQGGNVVKFERPGSEDFVLAKSEGTNQYFLENEVFAPAMSSHRIKSDDAESYLREAICFANEELSGTLGANIIIHPKTVKEIGEKKFEAIIADFHYGCIAINTWCGLGFSLTPTSWGAFPGHTLEDVQSGIGVVHNTMMFDKPERTVITAPFIANPRPAWFILNKSQHILGERLAKFEHRPGWLKIPGLFAAALKG